MNNEINVNGVTARASGDLSVNGTTACGNGKPINGATACASGDFGGLEFPTWDRQGWICPKCGNVMSPGTSYCIFCAERNSNTIVSTTTELNLNTSDWNSTGYHTRESKITICN